MLESRFLDLKSILDLIFQYKRRASSGGGSSLGFFSDVVSAGGKRIALR